MLLKLFTVIWNTLIKTQEISRKYFDKRVNTWKHKNKNTQK